ncbi:candidate histidine kinase, hybrid [Ramlibacter tataouinensis TTB310]|uniref:histidine kinase n=1 Tax=Ramlibacter tataouinensis (strain ATCC BAA-407 / DSM 14655 / LMG 21543 / TTB310) TaxID=365046 RepID=F5Y5V2_RAMTT|nr:candidate histidine kinase, hybrid [Ramlibacter tataouinensis TTB310]
METCGIGVWLNPMPLGALSWNKHVKAHFHLAPEAEVDMALFYERLHPDDRAVVERALEASLTSRAMLDLIYRTRGPGSALKWIRAVGRPTFDAEGRPVQFDGITLDVTREMQSQAELRSFADTAPAMLWVTEPDGRCSFLSQGWYDFTGQDASHALGFGWLEAVHPDDRAAARQAFLEANAGFRAFQLEHRLRRADGRWHWVIDAGQPRFDEAGTFLGFVGSVTDIHERRLAEQRLRDSEERYRGFVANSTEGIWRIEFDPPVDTRLPPAEQVSLIYRQGRFAECNDAFARMYGFSAAAELEGQSLSLMLPQQQAGARAYLEALIAQGYRASEVEFEQRDRGGRTLHFANSLTGVLENGWLVRAWGTQRDITDRKRAEQALLEADRRKDDFLATLAHELRNPLAPIRNAVELQRRLPPGHPALPRQRDLIDRQVSHLTRLVDDLLDVSRITRDKLELRRVPVAVADLVRDAVDSCRADLDAGRHALALDLPAQPLTVQGDPVRLVQILGNLLGNAARYSPPGTPVRLAVRAEAPEVVVFTVTDQGEGIAQDDLPRLFDLFFQARRGSDRPHGGLGIGLSLVQRLVQLHGGTVRASSAGPGRGSEFEVRLPNPAAAADVPAEAAMRLPAPQPAGPAARVLVVDDNRDAADTLAAWLDVMGCETATAYDGQEGLEKVAAMKPDAVVLDLGMPRLDGWQACERIRQLPGGGEMLLVAVSGWGQERDRQRTARAGFDAHLVKPIAPDALLELVYRHRRR